MQGASKMRNAIVVAVAVAAGVISTPAVSRPKVRTDNNITCPATPPTSDRTVSKERGGGLTIAGFGATATHGKVTSETDVVIRQEGTAGYNDLFLSSAACVAIVNKFPGQPQRQFEALEKEFTRLERRRAEKSESVASTAAADIVLKNIFANGGCPGGVTGIKIFARGTPPAIVCTKNTLAPLGMIF